jgi:V-type H+-transporting ATPase subunit a
MSMFRSDRMGYYTLHMPREYAWEVINELGALDCLQFVDQNTNEAGFNRPYANYIRRCEDLEAKVSSIQHEMGRFDVTVKECDDPKIFLRDLRTFLLTRNKAERTYFEDLEGFIEEKVSTLNDQIKSYDTLIENYNHLIEYKQVLVQTKPHLGDRELRAQNVGEGVVYGGAKEETDFLARGNIRFSYLAGVINREDAGRFKKILFRVTRGMAFTSITDIIKPKLTEKKDTQVQSTYFKEGISTETKDKSVFLIVYQGGALDMMRGRLNRICESFGASKYGIPEEPTAFDNKLREIDSQIREAQNVISLTQGTIKALLEYFAKPRTENISYSLIEDLRLFLLKEKAVYHNLNTLKTDKALYQGSCWCPVEISDKVRQAVTELKRRKSEIGGCDFKEAPFPSHVKPPTHFRLNDVTWVFQEIVNTYGTPRYREINPGLFAIVTFPFLFGVMFGDIGHGALLLAFGAYLCLFKEQIEQDKKSMLAIILPGRYLLLFQGFFAFYCGWMYNDFMAMPWNIFGSCYNTHDTHGVPADGIPKIDSECTYPFGIDSGWYGVSNELTFLNSFKMKLSIILGVTQMMFGIVLRGLNNVHFNNWLELIFEFIPMLLFLGLTFGYMAVLIVLKWTIPWGTPEYPTSSAPSIIGIFIKMVLAPGQWPAENGSPLFGDKEGKTQAELQFNFLIIAAVCAVLILIPKPIILWFQHSGSSSSPAPGYVSQHDDPAINERLLKEGDAEEQIVEKPKEAHVQAGGHGGHGHGDHFEFGEVFVHQVIETIEFVLGSISNTASYLRLWALSLAHSQLAKVFYDNTIGGAIVSGNFILAFVGFIFFAIITLGVLLLMDQMECFLHALRLHWVEFQGKFYKADGYLFEPLSFEKTLKASPAA